GDLPALAALLVGRGGTQTHRPPSGQAAALPPENEARLPVAGQADEDAAADCPVCARAVALSDHAALSLGGDEGAALERLCQHHTWRVLVESSEASEAGRHLAATALERLARGEMAPLSGDCALCRAEQPPLALLTDELPSGCLTHFAQAHAALANEDARRRLVGRQLSLWRELRGELDEFIRKRDYRFSHEPLGQEADAPRRAVAMVTGAQFAAPPAWPGRGPGGTD
ncbi:MAG: hypothetical protein ACYC4L_20005, partial [Chloroflexota bacterium]